MSLERNRLDAGYELEPRVMLSGTIPGAEAPVSSEAEAPVEEAAAAAEEAVVAEDAGAEEVIAEEAPVEEAPVEEPAAQEAPEEPAEEPCLLYTSPSPRDQRGSRMPSSA